MMQGRPLRCIQGRLLGRPEAEATYPGEVGSLGPTNATPTRPCLDRKGRRHVNAEAIFVV